MLFLIWASVACLQCDLNVGHKNGGPFIDLDFSVVAKDLERMATYNDAGAYYSIAMDGYEIRPFDASRPANWPFFPLHPTLWHAASLVFGQSPLVGVILANVYFFFALILLHRCCSVLGYDDEVADGALRILAFFPTSYFFSLPWSESLFLLVTCATVYAAMTRRWLWLGLLGIAACGCRLSGLFLCVSLLVWLWTQRHDVPRRAWIVVAAMPIGLLVFMAILYRDTGNAFAFIDIQSVWARHFELPIRALGVVLVKPWVLASSGNLRHWNFLVFVAGFAGAYWFTLKRRQAWMGLYLATSLLTPALTGSIASISRYGMALFPLSLYLGYLMKDRTTERVLLIVSAALFALMAVAFQLQISFAGV